MIASNGADPARWLGCAAIATALSVYTLGFLSLGRGLGEAFGIAVSHVAPVALAGWVAWRLQPYVRAVEGTWRRWVLHGAFAVLLGLTWAGGLLLIAVLFSPEVVPDLLAEVLFWTGASGTLVYAVVAGASATLALRRRVAERDAVAARAELAALRSRVEPHFLYNALESIAGLIRVDPDGAEEAIARLGAALRRVLDHGLPVAASDGLVPLAEELETVRDTLFVERLRMGDRLIAIERIEPDALERLVPPLTLQPLVENAIQHGLSCLTDGGTVSIAARVESGCGGERLVLEVADDGAGADEATLETAMNAGGGTGADRLVRRGVGLSHLRRRLLARYGERARVSVAATPGRGVSVQLAFPAEEA